MNSNTINIKSGEKFMGVDHYHLTSGYRRKQQLRRQRGFSLIEVMVSFGIISIAAIALTHLQTSDQIRVLANRQASARDTIKMITDRYILDSKIIDSSVTEANYTLTGSEIGANTGGNIALDLCIHPPTAPNANCPASAFPNCCKASPIDPLTSEPSAQPFHIIDPAYKTKIFSGTDASSTPSNISSTQFHPVRYNSQGARCENQTNPTPDCALELVTAYVVKCPGGAASCINPEDIFIKYSLRGATGITPSGGVPFKATGTTPPTGIRFEAFAAGGGGSVMVLKTGWYIGGNGSPCYPIPNGSSMCPINAPLCPSGWMDAGITVEVTGVASPNVVGGNFVRTCYK